MADKQRDWKREENDEDEEGEQELDESVSRISWAGDHLTDIACPELQGTERCRVAGH